jgi:hypothetical protein
MDIVGVHESSKGGMKYCDLLVDAFSGCSRSRFAKQKSQLKDIRLELFQELAAKVIQVQTIRCGHAGENKMLERNCEKKKLSITFEYTAPGTPQQSGVVESHPLWQSQSYDSGACLKGKIGSQLWAEIANCATGFDC